MMASPAPNYSSPSEGHTPIGSPAPSQILLHRVASPNHLGQHSYVESPRSVPVDYSQYSGQSEHFEYEHTPELYVNDDEHIYDFGPNGAIQVDHQFVAPQLPPPDNNLLFMSPNIQIQPPTPMHGQFAPHMQQQQQQQLDRNSMTPFSDAGSEYGMDSPDMNGNHLIDISASGFPIPTNYMTLPRSHPMQGRTYYDSPVFEDDGYDSRSPSPGFREQVKRPLNAFMLYRKDKQTEIPTSNHQSVSRIIGAMWKSESADTKAKYNALAQKEREKHRQAYPGYKYSPKKRINKDKKVRRTMSQAAHAKRQEEENQILRQINKRSQSEGTLTRPLPEFLPLPKSKQRSVTPDNNEQQQPQKSRTPGPESSVPRLVPQLRSHSAQPPTAQDFSKFTSNPQPQLHEEMEQINIQQGFGVPSQFPEQFEPYFAYPVDYSQLGSQNGAESVGTPFESETDSFTREFSAEANTVCSPAPFTPLDEMQLYGSYAHREDIDIFRMSSPFATEQKQEMDQRLQNPRVQNVFAGHWSRESTVNPQDLLAQPDDC